MESLDEKLRRLGYLNNPIDAFVMPGQRRRSGSLAGRIVAVGGRSALLVGPLLGLLTTVESALLLPGLLHRLQDLAVFGLYQICLSTAVFFLFGILWAGAVALIFRLKPRPVGHPVLLRRTFELLGGLFVFFYLSYWWNSRAGGVEGSTLLENLVATAVFAALSFWVGRTLGLSGYVVVMHLRPETPVPRFARPSARFALVAGLGCVGLFTLSLVLSEGSAPRLAEQGTAVLVPLERREAPLVLLGIDGLSLELLQAQARTGRTPQLARLLDEGALAPLDVEHASRVPPVVWTTLTTGIRPRGHGVRDFDTRILYGVRQPLGSRGPALDWFEALQNLAPAFRVVDRLPLSAAERQGKAIWEVLAEAGVRSAGLNWWASWPAGSGPALVVSDRLYTRLQMAASRPAGPGSSLAAEGETHPPELLERLARIPHCCTLPAALDGLLRDAFGEPARAAAATAHESDRFMREAALTVLREQRPSFVALYQRALDVTLRTSAGGPPVATLQRAAALGRYAELQLDELDALVAELRAQLGERAGIALVGLPSAVELEHAPGLRGVLLLAGPDARRAARAARALTVEDVAPTLLAYYHIPRSDELAGTAAAHLLAAPLAERLPRRTVPSYGARREALEGQRRSSYDERQIEMMRSLGYIE